MRCASIASVGKWFVWPSLKALRASGPVTQAGCGIICPAYNRDCYGCFGPKENANPNSLTRHYLASGTPPGDLVRLMRNFNANATEFRLTSNTMEKSHAS